MSQQKNTEKLRTFAQRFIGYIAKNKIQQNELAAELRVSPSAINNWKSCQNWPSPRHLRKLAELWKVNLDWISGEPLAVESITQTGIRGRCHDHLNQVLDECQDDKDRLTWTYVELKKHFPTKSERSSASSIVDENRLERIRQLAERELKPVRKSKDSSGSDQNPR